MLHLFKGLLLAILLSPLCFAQEAALKPVRPKGGVALTANPESQEGLPRRAGAVGARFLPGDPTKLVSAHRNGEVILWDWKEKKAVWRNKIAENVGINLELSSDGSFVFASSEDGLLTTIRVSDGKILSSRRLIRLRGLSTLAHARNAPVLAYNEGEDGILSWRRYEGTQRIEVLEQDQIRLNKEAHIESIALSDDGKYLAASRWFSQDNKVTRNGIHIYDLLSGEETVLPRLEESYAMSFSPDGQKLSVWGGPNDLRLVLYDIPSKKEIAVLHPELRGVSRLLFARDGKILFCVGSLESRRFGRGVYVKEFTIETGKLSQLVIPAPLPPIPQSEVYVTDLDISSDGKFVVLSLSDSGIGKETSDLPDIYIYAR